MDDSAVVPVMMVNSKQAKVTQLIDAVTGGCHNSHVALITNDLSPSYCHPSL